MFSATRIERSAEQQAATTTAVARVSLASAGTPVADNDHSLHIRARVTSAGSAWMQMALYEGANNRSGDLHSAYLTTSLAEYTLPITSAAASTITDYSDLEVRIWGASPASDTITVEVAEAWLVCPATGAAITATLAGTGGATGSLTASPQLTATLAGVGGLAGPPLAADASTPAVTTTTSGSSLASNAFSPPANSKLLLIFGAGGSSITVTGVTDSVGTLTWARLNNANGNSLAAEIWWADCPDAQTAMTVTPTWSGTIGNIAMVGVIVLTGAGTPGAGGSGSGGPMLPSVSASIGVGANLLAVFTTAMQCGPDHSGQPDQRVRLSGNLCRWGQCGACCRAVVVVACDGQRFGDDQ